MQQEEVQCKFLKGRVLTVPRTAWTGGDKPRSYSGVCGKEKNDVSVLFREQARDYAQRWGELPVLGIARLFWRRARYDAHASHDPNHQTPEIRYVAF